MKKQRIFDFALADHGLIAMIHPLTDAGHDWLADNIGDDAMYLGGTLAVEPRYAMDIVEGFVADGLTAPGTAEVFA